MQRYTLQKSKNFFGVTQIQNTASNYTTIELQNPGRKKGIYNN